MGAVVICLLAPAVSRAQWSPAGVLIFASPADPSGITPMADGQGGLYIVNADYRDYYGTGVDVYLQYLDAGGHRHPNWPSSGLPVSVMPKSQGVAGVAPDGAGGVLLTWYDDRDVTTNLRDVYVQRVNSDGSLPPGWQPNGVLACRDPRSQTPNVHYYPVIASDGAGGAYVAWDDGRDDTTGMARRNCYVQHLLADGSIAPGWPPDGRAAVQAPLERSSGPVIPDGEGGMVVVFGDTRRGIPEPFDVDIYGQRIQADGTSAPGWPAEGKLLVSRFAGIRGVLPDDTGGFYVVRSRLTEESHPYDAELWVHRFTFDGERARPAGRRKACSSAADPAADTMSRSIAMRRAGWCSPGGSSAPGSGPRSTSPRIRPDGARPSGSAGERPAGQQPGVLPVQRLRPGRDIRRNRGALCHLVPGLQHRQPELHPAHPGRRHDRTGLARVRARGGDHSPSSPFRRSSASGSGGAIVVWQANYNEFYATRFVADGPVAVSVALARSEAFTDRVALEWRTSEPPTFAATLERSERDGEWREIATRSPDGEGALRYEDRDVAPGRRYGYRLAWTEAGTRGTSEAVWLETPLALQFALHGFAPNPSPAAASVAFTLAGAGAARLEVLDVAGRRVAAREVGALGAGRHTLRLESQGPLAPGLYLLRLVTPARTLAARGVVVR